MGKASGVLLIFTFFFDLRVLFVVVCLVVVYRWTRTRTRGATDCDNVEWIGSVEMVLVGEGREVIYRWRKEGMEE